MLRYYSYMTTCFCYTVNTLYLTMNGKYSENILASVLNIHGLLFCHYSLDNSVKLILNNICIEVGVMDNTEMIQTLLE